MSSLLTSCRSPRLSPCRSMRGERCYQQPYRLWILWHIMSSKARYARVCSSGANVSDATTCFLVGWKTCFTAEDTSLLLEIWPRTHGLGREPAPLEQWFFAFLTLWHFDTVPHVALTSTIKLFLLFIHNCNFATLVNYNVNIRYSRYVTGNSCDRVMWPQRGHDP